MQSNQNEMRTYFSFNLRLLQNHVYKYCHTFGRFKFKVKYTSYEEIPSMHLLLMVDVFQLLLAGYTLNSVLEQCK